MFYEHQHFGSSEYFCKEYGENFSFPAHLHQSFEFITLLSGEMEIMVESTAYTLKPGEALLVFPHQLHALSSKNSKHMLCIFSPEIVRAYFSKTAKKLPADNKFTPTQNLIHAIDNLQESDSFLKKKGILYSLCAEFDEIAAYTEKQNTDKNLLSDIFTFVELNFSKNCSLKNLARKTGFSYAYLSRYFKNTVGISFNTYVNRCRISNACYLLNNSDDSILQCALDSGYTSLRSFNRNFKAITGVPPQVYRAK